jgi:hypothetical protein
VRGKRSTAGAAGDQRAKASFLNWRAGSIRHYTAVGNNHGLRKNSLEQAEDQRRHLADYQKASSLPPV